MDLVEVVLEDVGLVEVVFPTVGAEGAGSLAVERERVPILSAEEEILDT